MKSFLRLLFAFFIVSYSNLNCGGVGGGGPPPSAGGGSGTVEDPTNDGYGDDVDGGAEGVQSGSIFDSGPVDIPIPIAKVEAIDPRLVVVTISSNQLIIEGRAGAVPNPTASPQVWALDTNTSEQKTTTTISDGSFAPITFTYSSSNFSTVVTLAGYDGTSIATPIFIKVVDNTYIIVLTNGATLVEGALAMDENRVYLVSELNSSNQLITANPERRASGESVTSCIHTLTVGGVSETLACASIEIDQIFVDNTGASDASVLVRSGNTFYYPNSEEGLTSCCSIDSSETIRRARSYLNDSQGHFVGVATDENFYLCSKNNTSCDLVYTLDTGEEFKEMNFYHESADYSTGYVQLTISLENTNGHFLNTIVFDLTGQEVTAYERPSLNDDFSEESVEDLINSRSNADGTVRTFIYRQIYKEGNSGTRLIVTSPTGVATTEITGTAGSEEIATLAVYTDLSSTPASKQIIYYSLDASFDFSGADSVGEKTLLNVSKTHNVLDYELGFDASTLFFCAWDDGGQGKMYAYCPVFVPESGTTDGSEIIELTNVTCNNNKNWKIDHHHEFHSLAVVEGSDSTRPQIRFIDPETEPELEGCAL